MNVFDRMPVLMPFWWKVLAGAGALLVLALW